MRRVLVVVLLAGLLVPASAGATIYRPLPAFTVNPARRTDAVAHWLAPSLAGSQDSNARQKRPEV